MPALRRHIGKVPVAIVVIENRFPVSGHQQIDKSIVVVVRRRHRDRVHVRIKPRLLGDVREMPVAVITIKMVVRRRYRLVFQRIRMHRVVQRSSIHHAGATAAGVVVVDPDAPRARSLQQRTQLGRTKAVREIDSSLRGRIFKSNRRASRQHSFALLARRGGRRRASRLRHRNRGRTQQKKKNAV